MAYRLRVLFFKRILNFKEGALAGDKRGSHRYAVGPAFPIKAKLNLAGRDGEGNLLSANSRNSMDWGGQLVDVSGTGASIRLHPAAVAERGENCCLKLEFDHKLFELAATVAHFRVGKQFATCGVLLKFPDFHTQKAFLQLLEPVALGAGLEAVPPRKVKQDAAGLEKEQYADEEETQLTIWRDAGSKAVAHFELLMRDYCVRGSAQSPGLAVTYRDGVKVGRRVSTPSVPIGLTPAQEAEVRLLFQWTVPNLAKAVPADVRAFLLRAAA
jgi:hypothetical protein